MRAGLYLETAAQKHRSALNLLKLQLPSFQPADLGMAGWLETMCLQTYAASYMLHLLWSKSILLNRQ